MEDFLKTMGAMVAAMAVWSLIDLFAFQALEAKFKPS